MTRDQYSRLVADAIVLEQAYWVLRARGKGASLACGLMATWARDMRAEAGRLWDEGSWAGPGSQPYSGAA